MISDSLIIMLSWRVIEPMGVDPITALPIEMCTYKQVRYRWIASHKLKPWFPWSDHCTNKQSLLKRHHPCFGLVATIDDVALFQWSPSRTERNQSLLLSSGDTDGTGYLDVRIYQWVISSIFTISASPWFKTSLYCPSNETEAEHRLSGDTSIRNTVLSGNNICRKESVCGQMGVISIPGVSGCTIDPPADIE